MDLFSTDGNLLPYDGTANYFGPVINAGQAHSLFKELPATLDWQHDEITLYGKKIITKRKVAWYGDNDYQYTYSGNTKQALPWTPALLQVKAIVEERSGTVFNSCLANLYHDGTEGMSWHSDDEKELGKNNVIASVSLGAERKFSFRHKQTREKTDIILQDGSLLVMKGETQTYWQHSLPKTAKVKTPRINLTFRKIIAH